ncbi:hypothetical protein HYV82_00020 [Candidatus Woesearchaeota archaeon]|nr:hypothetical protein [Candidatus Woesearchaeota archaeon]
MKSGGRKCSKGYFFTLDAFIAMGIIVAGLAFVLTAYSYKPVTAQATVLGTDLLLSLANTKVTEINNDYVRNLTLNGTITNSDNSLLQQVGEFYVNNQNSMGNEFVRNVTYSLVPLQYGYELRINKTQVYNRSAFIRTNKLVTSSKSIVFGVYNNTMWGPLDAEVRVWQ